MNEETDGDPIASLEAAETERLAVEAEIDDVGREPVERVSDAYDRFDDLLSRYREPASGSGRETFQAYVEFEGHLDELVSGLPDDLLHRDAFEAAEAVLNRRRLEERDFDRARDELAPARAVAALLEELEAALERYRRARHAVEARRREVETQIDSLQSVLDFDDVDFDAPVETIRGPIEAYEDAVDAAFREFRSTASTMTVLQFVEATEAYPLVEFTPPPDDLRDYLRENPVGEEPVSTLLEWAGFTRSKLDHYVSDPAAFRASVATNRRYLSRLDAGPLHVGWPPPPAGMLRFRARELVAVVERFAPEPTVSRLHAVRDVARDPDYDRIRRTAVARATLTDDEIRRLRDGTIHDELAALRDRRDRLGRALREHQPR